MSLFVTRARRQTEHNVFFGKGNGVHLYEIVRTCWFAAMPTLRARIFNCRWYRQQIVIARSEIRPWVLSVERTQRCLHKPYICSLRPLLLYLVSALCVGIFASSFETDDIFEFLKASSSCI